MTGVPFCRKLEVACRDHRGGLEPPIGELYPVSIARNRAHSSISSRLLLEQIAPGVRCFCRFTQVVSQGSLPHHPGRLCAFDTPILEAAPESVGHCGGPKTLEQCDVDHDGQWLTGTTRDTNPLFSQSMPCASDMTPRAWPTSGTRCSRRDFMRDAGDLPGPGFPIYLGPLRQPHLSRTGCRQHQELEGEFDHRVGGGLPYLLQ